MKQESDEIPDDSYVGNGIAGGLIGFIVGLVAGFVMYSYEIVMAFVVFGVLIGIFAAWNHKRRQKK